MLAHADAPHKIIWVSLDSIEVVVFLNPGVREAMESAGGVLDGSTRELFNMIHHGYGNELERKYAGKLDSEFSHRCG